MNEELGYSPTSTLKQNHDQAQAQAQTQPDNLVNPPDTKTSPSGEEWISGIPLLMVVAGVTLIVFLTMLDVSIVATVCTLSTYFCGRDRDRL